MVSAAQYTTVGTNPTAQMLLAYGEEGKGQDRTAANSTSRADHSTKAAGRHTAAQHLHHEEEVSVVATGEDGVAPVEVKQVAGGAAQCQGNARQQEALLRCRGGGGVGNHGRECWKEGGMGATANTL